MNAVAFLHPHRLIALALLVSSAAMSNPFGQFFSDPVVLDRPLAAQEGGYGLSARFEVKARCTYLLGVEFHQPGVTGRHPLATKQVPIAAKLVLTHVGTQTVVHTVDAAHLPRMGYSAGQGSFSASAGSPTLDVGVYQIEVRIHAEGKDLGLLNPRLLIQRPPKIIC